jgi:hypothetical protein
MKDAIRAVYAAELVIEPADVRGDEAPAHAESTRGKMSRAAVRGFMLVPFPERSRSSHISRNKPTTRTVFAEPVRAGTPCLLDRRRRVDYCAKDDP